MEYGISKIKKNIQFILPLYVAINRLTVSSSSPLLILDTRQTNTEGSSFSYSDICLYTPI